MGHSNKTGRAIVLDADVVSHFLTAEEGESLSIIFPQNQLLLLDKVHAELQRWPKATQHLEKLSQLLGKKAIRLIPFPEEDVEILREFAYIRAAFFLGVGESACLSFVRHHQKVLASSNLRDIKHYCNTHHIEYLTTMDFLCHALQSGVFTIERCNAFIHKVLASGSRLPVAKMEEYVCRDISFQN